MTYELKLFESLFPCPSIWKRRVGRAVRSWCCSHWNTYSWVLSGFHLKFHFFPPTKTWWETRRKEQLLFSICFHRNTEIKRERTLLTSPSSSTCQHSSEHQSRHFETHSHPSWQKTPPWKFYRFTDLKTTLNCDLIGDHTLHATIFQGYSSGCEEAEMGTRHPQGSALALGAHMYI